VPWAERNPGFTLKLEEHIMELIKQEMNISYVAKLTKVFPQRIWHVFNRRVTKAIDTTPLEDVEAIGINETSKRKGHDYITLGANLSTGKVFKVVSGKDSNAVAHLADH
jgi:transposase